MERTPAFTATALRDAIPAAIANLRLPRIGVSSWAIADWGDIPERLMNPDREVERSSHDKAHDRLCFRLGRRGPAVKARSAPSPRKVSIEVDIVRIPTGAGRPSVGIEHRNHREGDVVWHRCARHPFDRWATSWFVAVNRAHDDDAMSFLGDRQAVARHDRTPFDRRPERRFVPASSRLDRLGAFGGAGGDGAKPVLRWVE